MYDELVTKRPCSIDVIVYNYLDIYALEVNRLRCRQICHFISILYTFDVGRIDFRPFPVVDLMPTAGLSVCLVCHHF